MRLLSKKYSLAFLFFAIFMIMSLDVTISNEIKNNINPFSIEAVIYPNEATAQNACTFKCLRNLEDCNGSTNCTAKWECDTGCGDCSVEWVKFTGNETSGTCNNSDVVVD